MTRIYHCYCADLVIRTLTLHALESTRLENNNGQENMHLRNTVEARDTTTDNKRICI